MGTYCSATYFFNEQNLSVKSQMTLLTSLLYLVEGFAKHKRIKRFIHQDTKCLYFPSDHLDVDTNSYLLLWLDSVHDIEQQRDSGRGTRVRFHDYSTSHYDFNNQKNPKNKGPFMARFQIF